MIKTRNERQYEINKRFFLRKKMDQEKEKIVNSFYYQKRKYKVRLLFMCHFKCFD